ncbi:MAG: DNA-directed RNA polymerase subunit beta', partial [Endomicrobium sp.]|nr:DNA-directed RNA polymerase subunit beta' [Endomicrobium sp.]
MQVTVASPEQIREWSYGEVKKPETINYRTFKPERDGLFCDRIFGPIKDWECHCGKYKYIKHKGVICDRCGVEVTESKVRRERFGHIDLAVPVAHLWFVRKPPSRIGILLDMKISDLEKVIYYTKYVVTDELKDNAKISSFAQKRTLLKEEEFDLFKYGINSPVVREEFKSILDGMIVEEVVLEEDAKKVVKQLKTLVKHQAAKSDLTSDEIAKKIHENIANGLVYYRCYFKSHCIYLYNDLDVDSYNSIAKILEDNFTGTIKDSVTDVSVSKSDKKIKVEFFNVEKEKAFNELRKSADALKAYEGFLRIEIAKDEIPFMRDFAKPEHSILLEESDIKKFQNGFGDELKVDIGAVAVRKLLEELDLEQESKSIYEKIQTTKSDAERARLIRKLRVVEGFFKSNTRPEWMIITVLPVIPPDLRPLVALDGGRFA